VKSGKLELMELENIVANTVYLKAREGRHTFYQLESVVGHGVYSLWWAVYDWFLYSPGL